MASKNQNHRDLAAEAAVQAAQERDTAVVDTITLSNGIVFRCKPVPPYVVRSAGKNVPKPEPPMLEREDRGRSEPNLSDPEYLQAYSDWLNLLSEASLDAFLLLGTEIVELPEGVARPEEDTWLPNLEFLGVEVDASSERARYLSWLRYYAITSTSDLMLLTSTIAKKSGVREGDVNSALDSFRGVPEGGADHGAPSAEVVNPDGDQLPRRVRRARARGRGT